MRVQLFGQPTIVIVQLLIPAFVLTQSFAAGERRFSKGTVLIVGSIFWAAGSNVIRQRSAM